MCRGAYVHRRQEPLQYIEKSELDVVIAITVDLFTQSNNSA